jgi:hypothetical protein
MRLMMGVSGATFHIYANGIRSQIGPIDEREWSYHASLILPDYERCHPDDSFDDLKHRAQFSKDDSGRLRDWMIVAAWRAEARHNAEAADLPLPAM